ncbi:MAG: hypothetical protein IJ530_11510 [Treponema sp.]|uniref:hypothetical protein n=1 Tax=Treponema sp. TaxID=166 RepID=UPI0025DF8644|nr:hypothetical protein [Treponema sp.]MBQ8680372.1 hypothetical protein [Treponema sp.]
MEKSILFLAIGVTFIFIPSTALIFSVIFKRKPSNIECLYVGIHCIAGLASIMAGLFFMKN